jgi:hypothetical protein
MALAFEAVDIIYVPWHWGAMLRTDGIEREFGAIYKIDLAKTQIIEPGPGEHYSGEPRVQRTTGRCTKTSAEAAAAAASSSSRYSYT